MAETGELLVEHVFCLHRIPRDIVSDRSPPFMAVKGYLPMLFDYQDYLRHCRRIWL